MIKHITKTEKETKLIGEKIASNIKTIKLLLIDGELGAGKTTLSKGIAKGLGIKKNINSPTFSIVNMYKLKDQKFKQFIHIDAYRLTSLADLESIAFFDFIQDSESLIIVEWGSKIKKFLKYDYKQVNIKYINEKERLITISLIKTNINKLSKKKP